MAFAEKAAFNTPPSSKEVISRIYEGLLPHQKQFCDDTEHRKLALVCGFGAGKTHALVSKACILAAMNVGFVSAVFEPTSPMLRDILIRTFNELLEQWEIPYEFRVSPLPEYKLIFEEGNHTILLRTILTYQRLRGQNLCAVGFDEADTVGQYDAEQAQTMALARLRSGNIQQFYVSTTPEGYGYCFKTFEKEAKPDTALIRGRTMDNPFLPEGFIDSLKENYPPQLIAAYLEGQFTNLNTGSVYSRFSRDIHVKDKLPDYRDEILRCGIDFNIDNTNAVVGVQDGNKLVIIDEIAKAHDTDALAKELIRRYPKRRILIYPDSSGGNRSTNAQKTDIAILEGYGFTNQSPKSNPPIKDRVSSVQALLCNGKGESRLEISSSCRTLIECLELQSWDEKTDLPDKQNGHDHFPDALGYMVYREFNLLYARSGRGTGIRIY